MPAYITNTKPVEGVRMSSKQWIVGTIVGGVVLFVLGYIIFNMLLADFYAGNAGSATGVDKNPQVLWAIAIGALAYAALVLVALKGQAGSPSVSSSKPKRDSP